MAEGRSIGRSASTEKMGIGGIGNVVDGLVESNESGSVRSTQAIGSPYKIVSVAGRNPAVDKAVGGVENRIQRNKAFAGFKIGVFLVALENKAI